jgi:hypothetical protein
MNRLFVATTQTFLEITFPGAEMLNPWGNLSTTFYLIM